VRMPRGARAWLEGELEADEARCRGNRDHALTDSVKGPSLLASMPVKQMTRASFHTPQLRGTDLERAVARSETEQPESSEEPRLRDPGNRIASIVLGGKLLIDLSDTSLICSCRSGNAAVIKAAVRTMVLLLGEVQRHRFESFLGEEVQSENVDLVDCDSVSPDLSGRVAGSTTRCSPAQ
jgi:hypothetical protein